MRRNLLTGIMFAGRATAVVYSPPGQISGDRTEELLRQLARRVKAANERAVGRV